MNINKIPILILFAAFFSIRSFAQIKFSDETKKYIDYNDSITVFKNALLIDGKGNAAQPHQTIIIVMVKLTGQVMTQKQAFQKEPTLLI
jgi:hypothetical protein